MKQTVHFSKTEQLPGGKWEATIAPESIRKGYTPEIGDTYSDEEVVAIINEQPNKNKVVVRPLKGIPSVGREYTIERK